MRVFYAIYRCSWIRIYYLIRLIIRHHPTRWTLMWPSHTTAIHPRLLRRAHQWLLLGALRCKPQGVHRTPRTQLRRALLISLEGSRHSKCIRCTTCPRCLGRIIKRLQVSTTITTINSPRRSLGWYTHIICLLYTIYKSLTNNNYPSTKQPPVNYRKSMYLKMSYLSKCTYINRTNIPTDRQPSKMRC